MDDAYAKLFENNRRWVASVRARDASFFERLSKAQTPGFLYIGCADSRIPANVVMGVEPGEVFVHRNIANLVVNTDANAQAVIEYAVTHLGVEHVIVCGHYGCGGVKAAMEPRDLGILNGWLREIRDIYRAHRDELDAIADEEARYRRLVELNVREQCVNVLKIAAVQRRILSAGRPYVHGWTYSLTDGLLHDLEVPADEILDDIRRIYALSAE